MAKPKKTAKTKNSASQKSKPILVNENLTGKSINIENLNFSNEKQHEVSSENIVNLPLPQSSPNDVQELMANFVLKSNFSKPSGQGNVCFVICLQSLFLMCLIF